MNNRLAAVMAAVAAAAIGGGFWYAAQTSRIQPIQAPLPLPSSDAKLSEYEARAIAERSCVKGGESLAPGTYNETAKTWWFDANLNATRPGCHPICVVSEATRDAEVDWSCTGLQNPREEDTVPMVTNFRECVAAGNPVMEGSPRKCRVNGQTFIEETASVPHDPQTNICTPDQRRAEVCAQLYDPVCAMVEVRCIRAPCPPIPQTFFNSCEACRNQLVASYTRGACEETR